MRRVPMILQSEAPECGIACVAMIASYHGFRTDLGGMRMRLAPSMKGVTLKAHQLDRRGDGHGRARRQGRARIAVATEAAGDPALGHESLRRADPCERRHDHGQRSGARAPCAEACRSVGPLHRRRDGDDAGRRVQEARRARTDQRVATGAHRDRAEGRDHAGAAAFAGARGTGDRDAVLPATGGRSRRRRARPRLAGGARHRVRACSR